MTCSEQVLVTSPSSSSGRRKFDGHDFKAQRWSKTASEPDNANNYFTGNNATVGFSRTSAIFLMATPMLTHLLLHFNFIYP